AAEFRPIQPEIVAESVEQRHIGLGLDRLIFAIHAERYFCHVNTPLELLRARQFSAVNSNYRLEQATCDAAAATSVCYRRRFKIQSAIAGVELAQQAVIEELRRRGSFRFGNCFGE